MEHPLEQKWQFEQNDPVIEELTLNVRGPS